MIEKTNILLVDDRPEGLVSLESVLKCPEYNLITASSGQEALAQVFINDFAVILMDVQMPDMDGFEATSIIKQREKSKNIPIIFMTANNRAEQYISIGYSVGAVDYVLKPFDPHILKSKVAVFVELYKKSRLLEKQAATLQEVERRDRLRILRDLELESRRRYQNLADAIPQIIFRADSVGEIEHFNQFWFRFTGEHTAHHPADQWEQSLFINDQVILKEKWHQALTNQLGFEVECRLRQGSDQEYRWHLLRVVPELDLHLNPISWIGVATDIHDQKIIQQELTLAKKQAEVANETKSNFLANMSHEIRTPLGIILGFSEVLMDTEVNPEEKKEAIMAIRRNGKQLSRIIDEILDLSKVEAGKMEMEKSEVVLPEFLQSLKAFLSLPAKEKGLKFQFKIDDKIPTKVIMSPSRVQQILVNLIGNAIKFSPKGSVVVSTGFVQNGTTQLRVSVKDSGPGLSSTQIENLFQPFTQIDTSMTRKHGGTGLGLALSRKLARAMGGEISIKESIPGEGCEFILCFPVTLCEDSSFIQEFSSGISPQPVNSNLNSETLKGTKVLLVEDSLDNQALFSLFLTMAGAEVEVANNGLEGVKKATGGHHDVVLMDIQMPELDGYGAIDQLRKNGYSTPIIALTAHGMAEDRQKCFDLGSNSHLTKPIDRHVLIESVQSFSKKKDIQHLQFL